MSYKFSRKRIGQLVGMLALGLALLASSARYSQAQDQSDCTGEITARVLKILRNIDGTTGLYLKEVGGPVLAACNERTVFEPASTIKVLHHLHTMLQVQSGSVVQGNAVTLETPIPWFRSFVRDSNGKNTSCPKDTDRWDDPLRDVLKEMMWRSDNRHTQAIRVYFGQASINATAQTLGMKDTLIQHRIGCGPAHGVQDNFIDKPNRLTLFDAGLLYEGVANGSLLTPPNRQTFYELMAGKEFDSTGIWRAIQDMIVAEAPPNMTAEQRSSFASQADTRYKAGNYYWCDPQCLYWMSIAGWAQIPFCREGKIVVRQFVFGIFFDRSSRNPSTAFRLAKAELLREQLRDALQAFPACSATSASD
jgi:hypothetical protein